jgi:hypothetical protein
MALDANINLLALDGSRSIVVCATPAVAALATGRPYYKHVVETGKIHTMVNDAEEAGHCFYSIETYDNNIGLQPRRLARFIFPGAIVVDQTGNKFAFARASIEGRPAATVSIVMAASIIKVFGAQTKADCREVELDTCVSATYTDTDTIKTV